MLDAVDEINISSFKYIDSVSLKGDKARIHFGVGAQTVVEVFKRHNLDPFSYALICVDNIGDGEVRYGIRYEQLLSLKVACLERKMSSL